MSKTRIDFLYLNEPDMIAAGVTDMARCVDVMEETLVLLRRGDFRMAGANAMSHGAMISFPKEPEFENMPADGPDRRFMAMPAYLGGRFHTSGVKWYGSNVENRKKGLPRSIHTLALNDADTGAPLAYMSANLISAYRTGAIPGVAAKHLARKDARTFGIVGPGVIGRSVTQAVMSQCPGIEEIVVNGIDQQDVDRYRTFIEQNFPHIRSVRAASDVEEVVRAADVVTVTVTTGGEGSSTFPFIDEEWIKPGAVLLLPSAVRFDDTFIASDRVTKVVDSWRLYDAWAEEYGVGAYQKLGIIGTHWHDLMRAGLLERESIVDMADIIEDAAPGRQDDDQIFLYSVGGMPVEDVAWATEVYRNAVDKGIGTKLNLWDAPNLA